MPPATIRPGRCGGLEPAPRATAAAAASAARATRTMPARTSVLRPGRTKGRLSTDTAPPEIAVSCGRSQAPVATRSRDRLGRDTFAIADERDVCELGGEPALRAGAADLA